MQVFGDTVPQKQGLLKLSPEILQHIFAYALAENESVLAKQDPENLAVRGLGLSYIQIYLEIAKTQLFYANNVFKFDQMETALCWLHRRTYGERQALRSLWVAYGGLHQEATIQMLHKLPSLSSLALDISPLTQDICNRDMQQAGRPSIPARDNLAALLGDVEFLGLQELVSLPKLQDLNFKLDIFSREENATTRKKVFSIYYAVAAGFRSPRNSIWHVILTLRAIFQCPGAEHRMS